MQLYQDDMTHYVLYCQSISPTKTALFKHIIYSTVRVFPLPRLLFSNTLFTLLSEYFPYQDCSFQTHYLLYCQSISPTKTALFNFGHLKLMFLKARIQMNSNVIRLT